MSKLLLLLLPIVAFTQTFEVSKTLLSNKYIEGPYLMYDCMDKHWVCASIEEYEECKSSTMEVIIDYKSHFKCVNYKKFENLKDCISFQKRQVTLAKKVLFCENKKLKSVSP